MNKICKFISDNTSKNNPNILTISQRDDGDIEMSITIRSLSESGIAFRASGSRLKNYSEIIKRFSEIIDLINMDGDT